MNTIKSMTGFSSNQFQLEDGQLSILIRAVNSRFLEIQFSVDDVIQPLENQFLKLVKSVVQRGKLDIQITLSNRTSNNFTVNQGYVSNLSKALSQLKQALPQGQLELMSVLQFPGVLQTDEFTLNPQLEQQIINSFRISLQRFEESRTTEGAHLAKVVAEKIDGIEEQLKLVKQELPNLVANEKARLLSKLQALQLTNIRADRLEQEIALLVQKGDIAEEYDRIQAHAKSIRDLINAPLEINGKRLDFISQELLRESNTMASKAASLNFSNIAIEFKVLSEQIREQVQNIE